MILPTDRSRIEPRLVALALKMARVFRSRPGNRESIRPGSLAHKGPGAGRAQNEEHSNGEDSKITYADAACGRW